MCTSILMRGEKPLFGRNMDLYYELDCSVVITPRRYPFNFRIEGDFEDHYALIGMAVVKNGYPLYCEAVNEHGLSVAGLDFPGNAFYSEDLVKEKANVSPFELIPWILMQCRTLDDAAALIEKTHITAINFSKDIPLSPLHWHIADAGGSLVFEVTREGARIYKNNVNVMTNNPTFGFHLENLANYLNLTPGEASGAFEGAGIKPFSFGLGSVGLPGDSSSASRFVRAAYLLNNSVCEDDSLSQFFHLLSSLAMVRGSVITPKGLFDMTAYSCCIDLLERVYYYTTYNNDRISAVKMRREYLEGGELIIFPLERCQSIFYQN